MTAKNPQLEAYTVGFLLAEAMNEAENLGPDAELTPKQAVTAAMCYTMYADGDSHDADDYWNIAGLPYRMGGLGLVGRPALIRALALLLVAVHGLDQQYPA